MQASCSHHRWGAPDHHPVRIRSLLGGGWRCGNSDCEYAWGFPSTGMLGGCSRQCKGCGKWKYECDTFCPKYTPMRQRQKAMRRLRKAAHVDQSQVQKEVSGSTTHVHAEALVLAPTESRVHREQATIPARVEAVPRPQLKLGYEREVEQLVPKESSAVQDAVPLQPKTHSAHTDVAGALHQMSNKLDHIADHQEQFREFVATQIDQLSQQYISRVEQWQDLVLEKGADYRRKLDDVYHLQMTAHSNTYPKYMHLEQTAGGWCCSPKLKFKLHLLCELTSKDADQLGHRSAHKGFEFDVPKEQFAKMKKWVGTTIKVLDAVGAVPEGVSSAFDFVDKHTSATEEEERLAKLGVGLTEIEQADAFAMMEVVGKDALKGIIIGELANLYRVPVVDPGITRTPRNMWLCKAHRDEQLCDIDDDSDSDDEPVVQLQPASPATRLTVNEHSSLLSHSPTPAYS